MISDEDTGGSRCGAPARRRVGRPRPSRLAAMTLVVAAAVAALVACGGSEERERKPSSTWDEMKWDEGVWE